MKKPKLLIVGAFPPPGRKIFGGIVTSCRSLLDSSFSRQFELILVDSTQVSNPPPPFAKRLWLAFARFLKYLRVLRGNRPDAVLIFASSGASLAEKGLMVRVCRLMQVPVLIFPRSGRIMDDFKISRMSRAISRFALGGATRILCQGKLWQDFAITDLGFKLDHAPIVPNWTATEDLLEVGTMREYKTNSECLRFLFLGWLEHNKGIMELLAAVADLRNDYMFTLSIAGQGHAEDDVNKFIETHALQVSVSLLGWVEPENISALMAKHDVLVLPSWAEGLPNAMVEAMATGLTVVVSAVGNIPSVIEDGKDGLLVVPRNVESLRSALESLLRDPNLLCSLAQNGHAVAKNKFSVEQASGKLTRIIHEAMVDKAFV